MPQLDAPAGSPFRVVSENTSSENPNLKIIDSTHGDIFGDRSKTSWSTPLTRKTAVSDAFSQKLHSTLQPSLSEETEDSDMTRRPATPILEPPQWAVPAKGDSRLEPVCEAIGSHHAVDLTRRPFFRVGRSPSSDIQLQHNTSSRRHAMIFHHPNGSCYVVDCGSSHGTFVNGVKVRNATNGGMVIPHRVRRGSLLRFGGPGAPCFVYKSFAVGFSSMVKELKQDSENDSIFRLPTKSSEDLVRRVNTRLGSFTAIEGGILKRRSFDEVDMTQPDTKRQRCVSPTLEHLNEQPMRLVSPDSPRKSRRVTFHEHPEAIYPVLVTPDEGSSDEEEMKLL
jgi:hypothetical protein